MQTKRFQTKVPDAQVFISTFSTWKKSQNEVSFWNQQAIKHKRENVKAITGLSVIDSVGKIGVQEAERLGFDGREEAEPSTTTLTRAARSASLLSTDY